MSNPHSLMSGIHDRFNEVYVDFISQSRLLQQNSTQLRELSTVIKEAMADRGRPKQNSAPPLSARLVQVVRLVSLGCNNNQMGIILSLSESTIDNYRTRAMKLMDAHCSASLTRFAIKHGFTSLQDELTAQERAALDEAHQGSCHKIAKRCG